MDEKLSEEAKPQKVTRSQSRHERRKRLISARRAAIKDPAVVPKDVNVETEGTAHSGSPENRNCTEGVTKSKARRLRKRNKIDNGVKPTANSGNNTEVTGSPVFQISECVQKPPNEDARTAEPKPKGDNDIVECRSDVIELNLLTKKPEATKIAATERELLENKKNLKISESLRPTAAASSNNVSLSKSQEILKNLTVDSSLEFIIKKESREIDVTSKKNVQSSRVEGSSEAEKSTKIPASSDRRKDNASDEVSLPSLATENSIEIPKLYATNETMSSSDPKMSTQQKTREQIKAEREAKKAAKAAAKGTGKAAKSEAAAKIVEAPASKPKESTKKIVKESKIDEIDGDVTRMTNQLTISEPKKKSETPVAVDSAETKSKAELRAERRAKQEAQRAAKQNQAAEKNKPKVTNVTPESTKIASTPIAKQEDPTKRIVKRTFAKEYPHEVMLFKHLYHEREQALINVPQVNSNIHPAIVRLGVQYASKVIVGSNARCVALLAAVKQFIQDFERPSQADFTRGLEASLQLSANYLHHCRPLAVSMQNALKHLKWQMTQLDATTSDEEAKTKLGNAIDTYIENEIKLADKAISITIQTKISNGDVILTYGYSSLINKILCDAYDTGRQFRVVVVDGRPWLEGREQLRRLAKHGLECSYVLINALSFIMPEVSKVFLGAHAILANGAVMSRVGTAQVALMAKAFNVPVLVACETHKTCERVQTDSIVYNEIADADELAQNLMGSSKKTSLVNWRAKKSLNLLNLTYDVTPADLVTAVVTELAILPCTSVPVILRIKPSEI